MKPYLHAKASVAKYGGNIDDYMPIHNFIDSTKEHIADIRHRAIFHNAFGIFVAEKVFGCMIRNSSGAIVSVRDIAEDHVLQDLGTIPSLVACLENLPLEGKFGFKAQRKKKSKQWKID